MNLTIALNTLRDYALKGATDEERIHVYDALAAATAQNLAVRDRKLLAAFSTAAASMATSMRGCDAAQLAFDRLLATTRNGGQGE